MATDTETPTIIDSHIHLYAASHLSQLNWTAPLPPTHILNRQNSVDQYRAATATHKSTLRGFVFLETDRKSSLDPSSLPGWDGPLDELAYLVRVARGRTDEVNDDEGHSAADAGLVLGIVPWAPVPAGPAVLEQYVARVRLTCVDEGTFGLVKGFRYLVQDKPAGTMLGSGFVEGLKWLGRQGFVFDLGIDLRQGGVWQLREACGMMRAVFGGGVGGRGGGGDEGTGGLKIVINHCCKPDLRLEVDGLERNELFVAWAECVRRFATYPTTYMKLSGLFSELAPQEEEAPEPIPSLVRRCRPWVEVVLAAFGPSRVMFGSDWPVCSAGGPGVKAWQHWVHLVTALLDTLGLSSAEKQRIWSGTAAEAYGISLSHAKR